MLMIQWKMCISADLCDCNMCLKKECEKMEKQPTVFCVRGHEALSVSLLSSRCPRDSEKKTLHSDHTVCIHAMSIKELLISFSVSMLM